ncbi:tRNA isopentenyltransferase [Candidatus Nanosynbacter lyticus]|uniref:tRNA isopentenyltransferase n=1 Tax=Candidatus Nanosynbacter lyticus TaxID=2093824 RepID=A0A6S4GSP0_9BACT|nr:restriction endonuclease subunit S [Candidatus Nanosynbacter lyticus]AJA06444.1 tRNA isopentenyltransferase [Candidatus Nanosynbacter lyticus]
MKVRLKELGTIFTGNTPSKKVDEYWSNRNIKFIKPDVIKDELCVISSANEYISASAKNVSRIVPANSILVTCIGKIGRVGITEEEVSFNQQINAIVPNEAIIPKYLAYAIYANRKQLKAIANAPVVPIINKTQFSDFKISICESVEKQNKIVRTLDVISEIITHDKKKIEALDELIKARFVEMFDDNFGEIVELGNVCDVRDGTHDSPKYHNAGYPLVTSKNICDGKIDFSTCNLIQKEDYVKINKRSKVDVGDVLMPMIGTVGNPIIVNTDKEFAIKNVALIKFKDDSVILNTFIKTLLESDYFGRAVLSKTKGGTQKFISLGDIRKLEFNLPPIELQHRFATFVAQIDKSKFAVQKSLEKTQLLFDSLMQEYFG